MAKTSVNAFRSSKYATSTNAAEDNAVLMRRDSCVEAYAEDAQAPASSFGSEKEGSLSKVRNSLPAGTASHTEDQPATS